ncbi:MAG: putative Ig domain-containing protein [Gemmatimonadota bacterium]
MRRTPLLRRWATRGGLAAITAITLATGMQAAATGAQAAVTTASVHHPPAVTNPYSPAYHHSYRVGVVPTIPRLAKMRQWAHSHPGAVAAASANDLNYGGGIDGIGVTTGKEKVYLVFYGSQWGTQGTNSSGDVTLSGDPSGEAPRLQEFFKGLGTGSELWSGVMTQYCDGVTAGSQSCPASNTAHVAYPTGGALAGVWVDESASSPSSATGHQLGVEAVNAAAHFGNTTAAANRDAQYVVLSPTGTNPDGWLTNGFCAWHDYNGDSTLSGGAVSSPYGDIAFTNFPYVTDQGASCGANFVNSGSAGTDDGVTIVEGHEYAETVTDQNPAGGWTDSSGAENGDKCAWITPGTSGGSFNLSLTTGSYAVQTTWANDGSGGAGACEGSHAIVSNGGGSGNTVTVTNPGSQSGTVGTAASLQISASDSASGQTLTYSASGLPAGLSINSSTGLISGTPTTAGTYSVTVTATDTTSASGSASFTWTIGGSGGCTVQQLLGNPGFETGAAAPWTSTAGVINANGAGETAHSGSWYAWLDGYGSTHTDTLSQAVTIPSGCTHTTFSFWLHIDTAETTTTTQFDKLTITANGTTLATFSNLNHASGYTQHTYSLSGFAGSSVTIKFTGTEDSSLQTSFVVDDTAVTTG